MSPVELKNPLSTVPNRVVSLVSNLDTLIRLRWVATGGVAAALFVAWKLGLPLPYPTHFMLVGMLALLNLVYSVWIGRVSVPQLARPDEGEKIPKRILTLLFAQIATDWILLTAFLHFSGGILNPFLLVFVLHAIIGVSLVDFNMSFYLTAFGLSLVSGMTLMELTGVLEFHPLFSGFPDIRELPWYYLVGSHVALGLVMFIASSLTYHLVQGIRERERKLYAMSKDLVALSEIRTEFLYRVTHELKSPVAAMMSAVDAVLVLAGDCLGEKAKDMLMRIRRRGEGLLNLIKDLLEIARLSTPSFEREMRPVDPAQVLEMVCETEEIKAEQKGLAFEVEMKPVPAVLGDEAALREIFSNLISNAVRYTPEGGEVRISLREESGKVVFEVSDTGIGISEEDRKKLFTEFFRSANARKFSPAGTGLGLAITKAHVERMGGTISVRSKLNEGTTFRVEFPAQSPGADGKGARS